jgi:D-glycero-D-manno-heptose 1,7-bisphosphate phosphatase
VKSPALFLDRDGVLNREASFIKTPEELEILPGVAVSLALARSMGFRLIVVSNQSGIARGLFDFDDLDRIHAKLQEACGDLLDAIYVCPHHPSEGMDALRHSCTCRKPEPGMLLRARNEWNLDMTASWLVGDAPRDIHAAHSVGVKALCVLGEKMPSESQWSGDPPEDFVADLAEALAYIRRVV